MPRIKHMAVKKPPRKKMKSKVGSSSRDHEEPCEGLNCIDSEAYRRYRSLSSKQFYPERGFNFDSGWDVFPDLKANFARQIEAQNWSEFVAVPSPGSRDLVWEFYANGHTVDRFHKFSIVRGNEIRFEFPYIQSVFNIPERTHTTCQYTKLKQNPLNFDEISRTLCGEVVEWKTNAKGQPTHLDKNQLTLEAKIWQFFINSKVFPSLNFKTVNKDRALLLYCIIQGLYIDISRQIEEEMLRNFTRKSGLPKLFYPSLICALCRQEHITGEGSDPLVPRKPQEDFHGAWLQKTAREAVSARAKRPSPSQQAPVFKAWTEEQKAEFWQYHMQQQLFENQRREWKYRQKGYDMSNYPTPPQPPQWHFYPGGPMPSNMEQTGDEEAVQGEGAAEAYASSEKDDEENDEDESDAEGSEDDEMNDD